MKTALDHAISQFFYELWRQRISYRRMVEWYYGLISRSAAD